MSRNHSPTTISGDNSIEARASFETIRYANCWEDAEVLTSALAVQPGDNCLSIASGGDNSLALLAFDPSTVVAADISRAQLAMVDLKRAAFASLGYDELLAFVGIHESSDRVQCYRGLKHSLEAQSRTFWDQHEQDVNTGVIHAGRFEHYFQIFRRRILPLIHSRKEILSLLTVRSAAERHQFYHKQWDTWRWRLIFRLFFSRTVMGRLGRDPEFFRYVDGNVADRILERVEYALTELSGHDNPYMTYILTGNFGSALPMYLRRDLFEQIRTNLHRLQLVQLPAEEVAGHLSLRFNACNLSDIFEYMSDDQFTSVAETLLDGCHSGARLAYWNMLVPRRIHNILPQQTRYDSSLSTELFARDRAFFYQAFNIERVV